MTNPEPNTPHAGTRDRLLAAMQAALGTRGYHGMGLNELLANANAPKGVLYHHFPGGKTELAVAAIDSVVAELTAGLDRLMQRQPNPALALQQWMLSAQKTLEKSGFERGCPLATVALESTPEDAAIRAALATGFAQFRTRLAQALAEAGLPHDQANSVAALMVSAYEGALLQARVAGNSQPMRDTTDALMTLLHPLLKP